MSEKLEAKAYFHPAHHPAPEAVLLQIMCCMMEDMAEAWARRRTTPFNRPKVQWTSKQVADGMFEITSKSHG